MVPRGGQRQRQSVVAAHARGRLRAEARQGGAAVQGGHAPQRQPLAAGVAGRAGSPRARETSPAAPRTRPRNRSWPWALQAAGYSGCLSACVFSHADNPGGALAFTGYSGCLSACVFSHADNPGGALAFTRARMEEWLQGRFAPGHRLAPDPGAPA